jgi:hypothetical protein
MNAIAGPDPLRAFANDGNRTAQSGNCLKVGRALFGLWCRLEFHGFSRALATFGRSQGQAFRFDRVFACTTGPHLRDFPRRDAFGTKLAIPFSVKLAKEFDSKIRAAAHRANC